MFMNHNTLCSKPCHPVNNTISSLYDISNKQTNMTNAKGFNNDPVNNFNLCLSSPYSMYYRKQQQQKVVVPSAYDKKSQTIPRTTFASTAATTNSSPLTATGKTRKRKAQMTLFHSPSDSQCIKREFLSFDNNLNCCLQNDRNFSDIHKGILEHSETRLSNAENYLQHLLIAMRKNSKANRRGEYIIYFIFYIYFNGLLFVPFGFRGETLGFIRTCPLCCILCSSLLLAPNSPINPHLPPPHDLLHVTLQSRPNSSFHDLLSVYLVHLHFFCNIRWAIGS
ncbi:unnamed protein product [Trichobilharzia regenti]|nr:unnamed protein product [Trichobilharzia regenti]